jgi:hypothetical protein
MRLACAFICYHKLLIVGPAFGLWVGVLWLWCERR